MTSHLPRWNHLYALWQKVLALPNLPQFDRWLSEEFKKNPKYGSRDRRWYSELLFAGVRYAYTSVFFSFCEKNRGKDVASLVASFEKSVDSPDKFFAALKSVRCEEFFVWTVFLYNKSKQKNDETIELPFETTKQQEFFEDVFAKLTADGSIAARLLLVGIPLWYGSHIERRAKVSEWNEANISTFLQRQTHRPPLWVRLNHPDKSEPFYNELEKEGFRLESFGDAVAVYGLKGIFSTEAYRNGLFEIQDYASQQIGSNLGIKAGELVWDACAGGGGKTLQIAAHLRNKGAVYASDVRAYKLEEVKKRARRAGFFNVRCEAWDGETAPVFPREVTVRGGFDRVLVDAPCSSTGTWRRNPDAKFRVDQSNIQSLQNLQLHILEKASKLVRTGGTLVYSTCSFAVDENEDIASKFVEKNPQFSLASQVLLGCPDVDADTMFAAVFRLKA